VNRRRIRLAVVAGSIFLLPWPARAGQDRPVEAEAALIEDATTLEKHGDLAGAAERLREALAANPRSLSALIALERILGMTGRTLELFAHLDTLIQHEPASVIGHQMRVRAWTALGEADSLREAIDAWIDATPAIETPYREAARAWRSRGEYARAVKVLEQGRRRIRRPDALALELGDAYADALQYENAAREWARAVGPQGQAFLLVQRRVISLPNGGAAVIPGLVDRLSRGDATPARLRAAAQLAVGAGLESRARRVASRLAGQLADAERLAFMIELARRSDGAGMDRLALWAYADIVNNDGAKEAWVPVRARMAELALAVGDTALAAESFRLIESQLDADAPARRQAMALRIEFMADEGSLDSALRALSAFRSTYGDAPELDAAAGRVANALIDRDRVSDAETVISGLHGAQASLARGRIRIHEGDVDRARGEFMNAAPMLRGAEATSTIALATLLGRLSSDGAALVTASIVGRPESDALPELLAGSAELQPEERAAILDYAADVADRRGLNAEAEQIRREIVDEFPLAPEAPAALLSLARSLIDRRAPEGDVRLLLERMILEYPRSALVPQARRELAQLAGPGWRN
jgi:tetratricopeptide (TPR) repeat protein